MILGTEEAYNVIDRSRPLSHLYSFIHSFTHTYIQTQTQHTHTLSLSLFNEID
jgi:hypothetical protein